MSILQFIDENVLLHEIGMNKTHCKYFMQKIKVWKWQCKKFDQWLKHHDLYDLYVVQFNKHSIYTLQSLKRCILQNASNWQFKILKNDATKDCFDKDAKLTKQMLSNVTCDIPRTN